MSLSFIEQRGHHLLHLEAVLRPRRLLSTSNFVRLEIATEFFIMSAEQSWILDFGVKYIRWELGAKATKKGQFRPLWESLLYLVLV